MQNPQRYNQLQLWLSQLFPGQQLQLFPLAGDASFRRYFRVHTADKTFVVMDAPPNKESIKTFIIIDQALIKIGLRVPEIFAQDQQQGFLLLSDFGDRLYLKELNTQSAEKLYQKAFESLFILQSSCKEDGSIFPNYAAEKYQSEMDLFVEWYLKQKVQKSLSTLEEKIIKKAFVLLIEKALSQPRVAVHRDYHSRNLLVLEDDAIGILDFQDAVWGPITYDLMSLLRDCYIDWPLEQIDRWISDYYHQLVAHQLLPKNQLQQFHQWFDWIGLQRNLKCIGIFSRLHIRDYKPNYLADIPRVFNYAQTVCQRYSEFRELSEIISECIERT